MESDAAIFSLVAWEHLRADKTPFMRMPLFSPSEPSLLRCLNPNKTMKNQKKTKTKSEASKALHDPQPDAAGIDIGAKEIWVAVGPDRSEKPVRCFGGFTQELKALLQWLVDCGIRTVAMESTGVYWIPLFQILTDAGINVCLVNSRHVKNVPGRKSDVQDCQWLQYLHSVGLLRASFRPQQAVCAVRSIYRYRYNLLREAGQHLQHMQCALDQMNIKLHHVIDDLSGMTGMAIIEDILRGQRDPLKLAKHRDRRIKATEEMIVKSLEGDWRAEHLFILRVAWENWKQSQQQIHQCDQELLAYTRQLEACTELTKPIKPIQFMVVGSEPPTPAPGKAPKPRKPRRTTSKNEPAGPWKEELTRFFGVDLTAIPGISILTSLTLMTEIGNDLSAFKTAHHFSSWLCLCPDNATSAGKVLRQATRRSENRARQALRMAAASLHHDKSYLGEKYRRLRTKLGAPEAITAMAHQLARIIWHLLTYRVAFDMSVFAQIEKANQTRRLKNLAASARQFGYQLTPIPA
jgi:transposase